MSFSSRRYPLSLTFFYLLFWMNQPWGPNCLCILAFCLKVGYCISILWRISLTVVAEVRISLKIGGVLVHLGSLIPASLTSWHSFVLEILKLKKTTFSIALLWRIIAWIKGKKTYHKKFYLWFLLCYLMTMLDFLGDGHKVGNSLNSFLMENHCLDEK